uniref:Replication factor A C-terminal domain-containing protein n=1 Tax=Brassica oleracea TaxID=3712 RepID=Q2A9I0_BRAOL|nr:hypothetical protein 27.t00040 [Brassica oleracea]
MARQGDGFEGNVQHLQHNPIYNCKTCNKDFEHAIHCVFFNYYLVVRVSDDSKGEVKFLLFNNIAERLIRRPAFELVQEADGLTHQARAARKEILNNKRTIGITTSNRGPYNSTQSAPTLANLSVSGINMHPSTRQGPNMTRHTIPTGPAVFVEDAPREATQSPFQQTKTNEFIPPPRFIVEDHLEGKMSIPSIHIQILYLWIIYFDFVVHFFTQLTIIDMQWKVSLKMKMIMKMRRIRLTLPIQLERL